MENIKGDLFCGDFLRNTMTFKIDGEFTLQAGKYVILKEKDYTKMYEALKDVVVGIGISGRLEGNSAMYNSIKSLLKEIEE